MTDERAMDRATHPGTSVMRAGAVLSGRTFWLAFAAAWLGVFGLFLSAGIAVDEGISRICLIAIANTIPLALPSIPLALFRRSLLRPEFSLGRMALLHVGIGLAYAVATVLIGMLVPDSLRTSETTLEMTTWTRFIVQVVQGLFLYTLMAGFLMWTESLVRVNESRIAMAHEAELRARAELKSLRAQFNPHFVFNTLHSLLLLVRAEPATAERAIEDVAALIRYASVLHRSDIDRVPFEDELAIAKRYIGLEQLRLEDRLRMEWRVDDGLGAIAVPAFTLQTLLENAIRHGVAPNAEGGTVRVRATRDGADLAIEVADDGPGADAAEVGRAEGRGLDLLRRRLAALSGSRASLAFETSAGNGFRACVRVPAEVIAENEQTATVRRIVGLSLAPTPASDPATRP